MYTSIQIYIKYVDSRSICMEKYYTVVKKATRIAILFLSLASCVKLGNLFILSVLQLYHLQNEVDFN